MWSDPWARVVFPVGHVRCSPVQSHTNAHGDADATGCLGKVSCVTSEILILEAPFSAAVELILSSMLLAVFPRVAVLGRTGGLLAHRPYRVGAYFAYSVLYFLVKIRTLLSYLCHYRLMPTPTLRLDHGSRNVSTPLFRGQGTTVHRDALQYTGHISLIDLLPRILALQT